MASLVSIIIPVYNAAKDLYRCVQSILVQSYTLYECLLIDDGSTDESSEICDSLVRSDSRIKVTHTSNQGVSNARNIGVDSSKGEYLIFIDADDYWCNCQCLETLVTTAEKYNADIVRGEVVQIDAYGRSQFDVSSIRKKKEYAEKIIDSGCFYRYVMCGQGFLPASLFRRSALGSLRLNRELTFCEDLDFYARFLSVNRRCVYIPMVFYSYVKSECSTTMSPRPTNQKCSFELGDRFDNYIKMTGVPLLKKEFQRYSCYMYYWTIVDMSSDPYYSIKDDVFKICDMDGIRYRNIKRCIKYSYIGKPLLLSLFKPNHAISLIRLYLKFFRR